MVIVTDDDPHGSALALVAADPRARVAFDGFDQTDARAIRNDADAHARGDTSLHEEEAISLAFSSRTMATGESVRFRHANNLSGDAGPAIASADFDEDEQEGDGVPDSTDACFRSGGEFFGACSSSTTPLGANWRLDALFGLMLVHRGR